MNKTNHIKYPNVNQSVMMTRQFLIYCIFALLLTQSKHAVAKLDGDVELLKLIADGYETTFEKIKTWHGTANTTSTAIFGEKQEQVISSQNAQVEFLVDRENEMVRWNGFLVEGSETKDGKENKLQPIQNSGIVKKDFQYRIDRYDPVDQSKLRTMLITTVEQLPRNFESSAFDPFVLLKEISPISIPERMRFYYEKANSPKLSPGTVTRKGDIVTLESWSESEEAGKIVNKYVFDLSKGCNILEFLSSSDLTQIHWKLDYQEMGGVYIMKEVSLVYEDKRPGSKLISKKKAILSNKMINEPVSSTEFEFDKIGLRPGDTIFDKCAGGVSYKWKEVDSPSIITTSNQKADFTETSENKNNTIEENRIKPKPKSSNQQLPRSNAENNAKPKQGLSLLIGAAVLIAMFAVAIILYKKSHIA